MVLLRFVTVIAFGAALSTTSTADSARPEAQPVQVQMRNVALHLDEHTVLNVRHLRGELISTRPGSPPVFDDKNSFVVKIDSGEMSIGVDSLSRLLNEHVFREENVPLKNVAITTEGTHLKITGTMKKGINVPFSMTADPQVDSEGNLRLRPVSMKALGFLSKGVLDFLGLKLDRLIHPKDDRAMRIDRDEIVLKPAAIVPPPRIEGRLKSVRVEQGGIVEEFESGKAPALKPPVPNANYMYYRGGVLRFGKLTMTDADLELIDKDPRDPFDFFQDRYNDQLVAGYSKNTKELGLTVYMPDYHSLRRE